MSNYRVPRILSTLVLVLGWIIAGSAALVLLLSLLKILPPAFLIVSLAQLPTFLAFGLVLVLLSHVAKAVFDIADGHDRGGA